MTQHELIAQDYQPQHLEDFKASAIDPELVALNIRSIDLTWVSKNRGGEEIKNEDILFLTFHVKWLAACYSHLT